MDATKRASDADIEADPPVIAIMDSGLDYEHPALASQLWENPIVGQTSCMIDTYGCNTTAKVKKGLLGNGDIFPSALSSTSQSCNKDCAQDDESCKQIERNCKHGTHVAGIVAGQYDKGKRVAGVCPFCKIITVKIVEDEGSIPDAAILKGFKYISLFRRKQGNANVIRVINSSFGKLTRSRATALLVRLLKSSGSGTLVISAAGNEETMKRSWPAAVTDAIAVSALDVNNKKTSYSNFGPWIDIAAPGGTSEAPIYSSAPGGEDHGGAGTSQATPVVAGVAGLILAIEPGIDFNALRSRLLTTADPAIYSDTDQLNNYSPKIAGETVRRPLLGSGIVDALAAVTNKEQGASSSQVLNRVRPACGTVQHNPFLPEKNQDLLYFLYCLILFPIFMVFVRAPRNH